MVKGLGIFFVLLGLLQLFTAAQFILMITQNIETELLLAAIEPYKNGKIIGLNKNVIILVSIIGGLIKLVGGYLIFKKRFLGIGLLIIWLLFSLLYEFNAGLHMIKAPVIFLLIGVLLFTAKTQKNTMS